MNLIWYTLDIPFWNTTSCHHAAFLQDLWMSISSPGRRYTSAMVWRCIDGCRLDLHLGWKRFFGKKTEKGGFSKAGMTSNYPSFFGGMSWSSFDFLGGMSWRWILKNRDETWFKSMVILYPRLGSWKMKKTVLFGGDHWNCTCSFGGSLRLSVFFGRIWKFPMSFGWIKLDANLWVIFGLVSLTPLVLPHGPWTTSNFGGRLWRIESSNVRYLAKMGM